MKKRYWEKPPATKTQIKKFVKDALEKKYSKEQYLYLGKPSNAAIKRIKKATGYDIDKVTLGSNYIIHALNEQQFKKHKLSDNDITRIMDIINDENTIIRISKTKHLNKEPIEFIGYINGKIILVEAVKEKWKELRFIDLYRPKKENIGDSGMQAIKPPSNHVRNASPPTNNIVNNEPNGKEKTQTTKENPAKQKKVLEPKNPRPILQNMAKAKKKLSPAQEKALEKGRKIRAQNLAKKKAAQKKTATRTKKNPTTKKPAVKKRTTSNNKPKTTRRASVRKNPLTIGETYIHLPEPPAISKTKPRMVLGRMPEIQYISEAGESATRPYKFKHDFPKDMLPYLVTDGKNLFIIPMNKKMRVDFEKGIIG